MEVANSRDVEHLMLDTPCVGELRPTSSLANHKKLNRGTIIGYQFLVTPQAHPDGISCLKCNKHRFNAQLDASNNPKQFMVPVPSPLALWPSRTS
jgi:hypothetical protein